MKIWHPKTREYENYENFRTIVGNNKNFYSKIKTGIGWFNDDCSNSIIEYYETIYDTIKYDGGISNKKSFNVKVRNKFISIESHNSFINHNRTKFFNSNYPDFINSDDFINNQNVGGPRFGYPRFRVWYSIELDIFRVCLPLEFKYFIKNPKDSYIYKRIYNNCNMSLSENKPLIKFDKQFYKYSNYNFFKKLKCTESDIVMDQYYKDMGDYILDETPEDYSWDDYAVSIYG